MWGWALKPHPLSWEGPAQCSSTTLSLPRTPTPPSRFANLTCSSSAATAAAFSPLSFSTYAFVFSFTPAKTDVFSCNSFDRRLFSCRIVDFQGASDRHHSKRRPGSRNSLGFHRPGTRDRVIRRRSFIDNFRTMTAHSALPSSNGQPGGIREPLEDTPSINEQQKRGPQQAAAAKGIVRGSSRRRP